VVPSIQQSAPPILSTLHLPLLPPNLFPLPRPLLPPLNPFLPLVLLLPPRITPSPSPTPSPIPTPNPSLPLLRSAYRKSQPCSRLRRGEKSNGVSDHGPVQANISPDNAPQSGSSSNSEKVLQWKLPLVQLENNSNLSDDISSPRRLAQPCSPRKGKGHDQGMVQLTAPVPSVEQQESKTETFLRKPLPRPPKKRHTQPNLGQIISTKQMEPTEDLNLDN